MPEDTFGGGVIMYILISLAAWLAGGLYWLMKRLPVRYQVCFFSRQSNKVPVDFRRIEEELKRRDPTVKTVMICHQFRNRHDGAVRFSWDLLRSMYYLATSRVCILDAYWPTVSMLKHKKELTVIQIWHSIGKIKKSGYQTLGQKSGRSVTLAKVMRMHRNYDYVIAGGRAWNPYYCASFDIEEEKLRNFGLPRLDEVLDGKGNGSELLEKYPELQNKTVILYAPTYRKWILEPPYELTALFDPEQYAVVCRFHPNQQFNCELDEQMNRYSEGSIFDYLQICDYFITDYSSLALEAAALNKKTLYYLFDYDQYRSENGLNIDLQEILPRLTFQSAEDIADVIEGKRYPQEEMEWYRAQFLPDCLGKSTEKIVDLIEEKLGRDEICDNGRREDDALGEDVQNTEAPAAYR